MVFKNSPGAWSGVITLALLWGCQRPHAAMDTSKPIEVPRPAQLDNLNMLVGQWTAEYKMKVAGSEETMTGKGTNTIAWELDNRFIGETYTADMGKMGTIKGRGYWTWDAAAQKYRMWWFDSFGMTGSGKATYDEGTKTWRIKTKGRNPADGKPVVGQGTMTFTDNNTITWDWTEWSGWWKFPKLRKLMEMSGTSRKK